MLASMVPLAQLVRLAQHPLPLGLQAPLALVQQGPRARLLLLLVQLGLLGLLGLQVRLVRHQLWLVLQGLPALLGNLTEQ